MVHSYYKFNYPLAQVKPFHYKKPPSPLLKSPPTQSLLFPLLYSSTNTRLPPPPPAKTTSSSSSALLLYLQKMKSVGSYYTGCEEETYQPHFLDCCFLCHRSLGHNSDIFMYRGNTPFCSQECRQEQIEMDEANEKKWRLSSSSSSSSSKRSTKTNTESKKDFDPKKSVRTSTVAVA